MPEKTDPLLEVLSFLSSIQKERGLAALFLSSRGKRGGNELKAQFELTDACVAAMHEPLQACGLGCEALMRSTQALPSLRANIIAQHAWANDVIDQYTQALVMPVIGMINDMLIRDSRYIPGRVSALLYLLHWQERLAREREIVSQLAGQEWMSDDAFASRLKHVIRERQGYERLFLSVADDRQRQACSSLRTSSPESRPSSGAGNVSGTDKFSFFNERIDSLFDIAKKSAGKLIAEMTDQTPASYARQSLDADVEAHIDVITDVPLFRDIDFAVLRDLLRSARLAQFDKGSIFVTQGETPGRFFIILEGWVKIYKGTSEGDESILQLLGRREHVLGTDVLYPGSSPVNARAITRIKLLSLPSNALRDAVTQNRELALNMLAASSRRAQKLIGHFEQITLRSATQRVGAFLLNLYLETGIGRTQITLPFEKSLIAAYLGIKPETFSRILQNFRSLGFRIERNQIILPEPYALCDFCEADSSLKCDLTGTASCPRAENARREAV